MIPRVIVSLADLHRLSDPRPRWQRARLLARQERTPGTRACLERGAWGPRWTPLGRVWRQIGPALRDLDPWPVPTAREGSDWGQAGAVVDGVAVGPTSLASLP